MHSQKGAAFGSAAALSAAVTAAAAEVAGTGSASVSHRPVKSRREQGQGGIGSTHCCTAGPLCMHVRPADLLGVRLHGTGCVVHRTQTFKAAAGLALSRSRPPARPPAGQRRRGSQRLQPRQTCVSSPHSSIQNKKHLACPLSCCSPPARPPRRSAPWPPAPPTRACRPPRSCPSCASSPRPRAWCWPSSTRPSPRPTGSPTTTRATTCRCRWATWPGLGWLNGWPLWCATVVVVQSGCIAFRRQSSCGQGCIVPVQVQVQRRQGQSHRGVCFWGTPWLLYCTAVALGGWAVFPAPAGMLPLQGPPSAGQAMVGASTRANYTSNGMLVMM